MTAPALVMLADGATDPRVTQALHTLRHKMQSQYEKLDIQLAFTNHCSPSPSQVINTLINRGVDEVCVIPLSLTHAIEAPEEMQQIVAKISESHPEVSIQLAQPVGPATCMLNILDERIRVALARANCSQLDGLVISTPDSGDTRGAALLSRRTRQWAAHHKLPVRIAVSNGGPSVAEAIDSLHAQGRRHVAVASLFLTADTTFLAQGEQAVKAGAIAVSAPIGYDERIQELVMLRYSYAAMDLLDRFEDEVFETDQAEYEESLAS